MLFSLSQDSLKNLNKLTAHLPFLSKLLTKTLLTIKGYAIGFFVIKELEDLEKKLIKINKFMPIISLKEAINILQGQVAIKNNYCVLIIEMPYNNAIKSIKPIIEKLKFPLTIVIDNNSLKTGNLPWIEEISFFINESPQKELILDFFDRPLLLGNKQEKKDSIKHLIDNLSHCHKELLLSRILKIKELIKIRPKQKVCSQSLIAKLDNHGLFSFISAGEGRWPFYDLSLDEIKNDLNIAKNFGNSICPKNFLPIYWFSYPILIEQQIELIRLFKEEGYMGAFHDRIGIARPSDNLFFLPRLPFLYGLDILNEHEILNIGKNISELF